MISLRHCGFAITLLVAVAAANGATAQRPPNQPATAPMPPPIKDPKVFAADFFSLMQKNQADAYDGLKSSGLNASGVDNLKQTAARLASSIGQMTGSEFLDEAHLGKRVTRLSFLVLYQRGPVVQTLTYYMPPGTTNWQLISMDMTAEPGRFPFQAGK